MKILAFIATTTIIFLCNYMKTSLALDTIIPNQNLYDKNGDTLVSAGEAFELGFFAPRNSSNRYVGVWFKKTITEKTVVWVANRDKPLRDSSGILRVTPNGRVVILRNQSSSLVWSSGSSTLPRNPVLQLLNTGNLVVKDGNDGRYIWQSFDHPCDTMISGMKLGLDLKTGKRWILSSWKSLEDPSIGDYSYEVDAKGLPVLNIAKGTEVTKYRTGPWDGVHFGDFPALGPSQVMNSSFVFNSTDVVYSFEDNPPVISRLLLNESGYVGHYIWDKERKEWQNIFNLVHDQCDAYGKCSSNEICNPSLQDACQCLPGYRSRNQNHRGTQEQGKGCERKPQLNCSEAVGFKKLAQIKLPDNSHLISNKVPMELEKCRDACLRNCSCVAYASNMASACIVWLGDMLDTKQYNTSGPDLYIKVAASELESKHRKKRTAIIVLVSVTMGILLLALFGCIVHRKMASKRNPDLRARREKSLNHDSLHSYGEEDLDLPIYDMKTIADATDNFSSTNKIGEGGFGCVYKGTLPTGQEIAVKRLSKDSLQGLKEFKNEVILISKLQHRNLVRLLGCCIYREERMLIYEYMPNRSLDFYIFDPNRDKSLDWKLRFEIIAGIARGLLYLHRDSILRIIHRDLKANNILLDGHMNPKISDFGLARIFGGDQTEANTIRIMGTYGYMSPEYVVDGVFSTKSDVFSFGVLVLEIVSGKKNRGFFHPDHDLNLLGHAWNLWNNDRPLELVDRAMGEAISISEILLCIQLGLLCVQQRPEDRPTMSSVLLMLDSENPSLPQPKQPGFYNERFLADRDSSSSGATSYTSNEATMTMPQGR